MEKCLYVSDLDGTLLRSDETISEYTCNVINKLTENGITEFVVTGADATACVKSTCFNMTPYF